MGIIQKQAIQSTFFSYAGALFGFLNASIILPLYLSTSEIGLITFFNSSTKIIASIFTLGIPLVTSNLFMKFKNDEKKHHGFLTLIFVFSCIGILFGITFFFLLQDIIVNSDNNSAKAYKFFTIGWILLFIFRLLFMNLDSYLRMNLKSVMGTFLESFLSKLIFFFGLIAYIFGVLNFDGIFWINILHISLPAIVVILYLAIKKEAFFNFRYFSKFKEKSKQIGSLALFGLIGTLSGTFITDIDKLMISNHINLSANGVYSTLMLFGAFIAMPAISLKRIATPILSKSWKENDMDNIRTVYKKSALNQFIIGFYIFLGIWFCIHYLMDIVGLSYKYRVSTDVILFIGLGQMFELCTGVNGELIATSKSYRWNTYFLAILIFSAYLTNLFLIPKMGIEGAALATAISIMTINFMRLAFVKWKYDMTPFTKELLLAIFIGIFSFGIIYLVPKIENSYIGILLNGCVATLVFWPLVYIFKLSPEINGIFNKLFQRFGLRK